MIPAGDILISRLRVISSERDELTLRLKLSSALSDLRLPPTSLPPTAILFVRRFDDPRPALLNLGPTDSAGSNLWQEAVAERLGTFAHTALRPAHGWVSDSAESILFSDKAEMMACLAQDWCAGLLSARWWWRALLRNDYSFWTSWIRNPEYVPAAMEHLARANKVIKFAASLNDEEPRTLAQQVVTAFALHNLTLVFEGSDNRETQITEALQRPLMAQRDKQYRIEESQLRLSPPWRETVPEVAATSLSQWQELFAGLALMISRAPSLVRTKSFALDVFRWQHQQFNRESKSTKAGKREPQSTTLIAGQVQELVSPEVRLPIEIKSGEYPGERAGKFEPTQPGRNLADSFERVNDASDHESQARELTPHEIRETSAGQPSRYPRAIKANEVAGDSPAETRRSIFPSKPTAAESEVEKCDVRQLQTEDENTDPLVSPGEQSESIADLPLEPEACAAVEIETNLGGFFYLINLALHLELYGDFTRPNATGLDLNIWDFVSLVGSELIVDPVRAEPLLPLLAALAGREPEAPLGEHFEPSDNWRLRVEWLSGFETDLPWQWNAIDDRLRVCHANGFPVLDLSTESKDVRGQLNREIEPYRNFFLGLERSNLRNDTVNRRLGTARAIQLWLSRLMPYLRARLRAALGPDAPEDPGPLVCRQNAIVRATETHVDVFFKLSEHPIELRLAGLDRDPGWVPAAGRFISFHYD